jgi:hypothetical protein
MLLLSVHFAPHLPMHSAAFEAKDIAKGNGRPLRILHSAITAGGVARQSLDNGLVGRSHLHHPGSKYGILPRRFSTMRASSLRSTSLLFPPSASRRLSKDSRAHTETHKSRDRTVDSSSTILEKQQATCRGGGRNVFVDEDQKLLSRRNWHAGE